MLGDIKLEDLEKTIGDLTLEGLKKTDIRGSNEKDAG